jgi:capsular polysaccharide export protein
VKGNLELIEAALGDAAAGQKLIYRAHPKNPANEAELALVRDRFKDRVTIMAPTISFVQALSNKPHIVTMTSGAGLEAAVRGCRVTCHSVAFFSNWGFTWDMTPCPRRTNTLGAEDVFLYFYTRHSRYFHPYGDGEISPLEALRGRLRAEPTLSLESAPSMGLAAVLS